MPAYVFDVESDGLLRVEKKGQTLLTKLHSLVLKNLETGEVISCADQPGYIGIEEGLKLLANAEWSAGHNIIRYDLKAIEKLYPWWKLKGPFIDTFTVATLIWPEDVLRPKDFKLHAIGKLPGDLIGRHKLEAWGHRLGEYKGDFEGPYENWSVEMQKYCEQDVEVTYKLLKLILSKNYSKLAIDIEQEVAEVIFWQEWEGVCFDEEKAHKLYAELVQLRLELERELQKVFPAWETRRTFTPKVNNKKLGYKKGVPFDKITKHTFNPGSRDHIADRLKTLRGWQPTEFTDDGKVKVDENVLSGLPYPEIPLLMRYLLVQKRIGQLAEGKEALLKHVRNGRIHGRVETNKAVTGRASHSKPNLGQVPKVQKHKIKGILYGEEGGWGYEFRSLFVAPPGWVMLGADASGLELRMLGHYMARWDGGRYVVIVVEGDVHSENMNAAGLDSRDNAKTFIYAFLYGAGDEKIGKIVKKGAKAGAALKAKFLAGLPALKFLLDAVKAKALKEGVLKGLDGRLLQVRSQHAALNTLLQSAGALVCKLWLCILHKKLKEAGYVRGKDYAQVLWVHDEVQLYVRPEIADEIGKIAVQAVKEAGERFGLKAPLTGEYKTGNNWAETH